MRLWRDTAAPYLDPKGRGDSSMVWKGQREAARNLNKYGQLGRIGSGSNYSNISRSRNNNEPQGHLAITPCAVACPLAIRNDGQNLRDRATPMRGRKRRTMDLRADLRCNVTWGSPKVGNHDGDGVLVVAVSIGHTSRVMPGEGEGGQAIHLYIKGGCLG